MFLVKSLLDITLPELNVKFAASLMNDNLAANEDTADSVSATATTSGGRTVYSIHFYGSLTTTLQVGSEAEDIFTFKIGAVNSGSLGVYDINVKDTDGYGARYGIEKVKKAIEKNSKERSNLGAVQNRLEHLVRNLNNVVENTTASESRIRDTEMACKYSEYAKNNILIQADRAVLAQANQTNQGVLSLLQ